MRQEQDHLRASAASFVVRLHQALSVARLHNLTNVALSQPIEELRASLAVVIGAQGHASLKPEVEADLLFLNDRAIHLGKQGATTLKKLIELLVALGLGELRFERRLTVPQIRALLAAFKDCTLPDPRQNYERLRDALAGLDAPVRVLSTSEVTSVARARSLDVDDGLSTRLAYARTLVLLRAFFGHVGNDELQRYFWRKLVRSVHGLQVLAARAPQELIALTSIHDPEERAINHALNTCVFALLLGNELGLPRAQLTSLGLAALVHGVGRFPADALILREQLTADEARAFAKTPYRTVGTLLGMHRIEDATLLTSLLAFAVV
ncbi:hypothetical protein HY251_10050, partial [bacterium]|nr:hypothetical protein [bacterium]